MGDIVECDKDLAEMFGEEKFIKVDERVAAKYSRPLSPQEEALQKKIDELQNQLHQSRQSESTTPEQLQESNDLSRVAGIQQNTPPPKGLKKVITNDVLLNLEAMTVKELQGLAAENEIDIKNEGRKAELIKVLRSAVV